MGDCLGPFPRVEEHPFKIITFDWDGTAVTDRRADASAVAAALEDLLRLEVLIVVVTGTNFGNIDRQFCSLITGAHKRNLFVCANRGSEVFGFGEDSRAVMIYRKEATPRENELLDNVAEAVKRDIERRSQVSVNIIYDRLNRRKIDLIPEWPDPPKSRIGELIDKTEARLRQGGFEGGIKSAYELAGHFARQLGLTGARLTSDVKHIEVGLTDKSDSVRWIIDELCRRRNIPLEDLLVAGDEFGPVAGFNGSDFHMTLPGESGRAASDAGTTPAALPALTQAALYVSVGPEPNGVPTGVLHLGGGPDCFLQLIRRQEELHMELLPSYDPTALLVESGFNPLREREVESLMAIGNGYLGTRGSLEEQVRSSNAATLVAGVYDRASNESIEELVVLPDWLFTQISVGGEKLAAGKRSLLEHRRVLDLKKGMLFRQWRHRGRDNRVTLVRFIRFASLDDPHASLERITVRPENYQGEFRVRTGLRICPGCVPAVRVLKAGAGSENGGALVDFETAFTGINVTQFQKSRLAGGFIQPESSGDAGDFGVVDEWRWTAAAGQTVTIEKYVSTYTSRESINPRREAADSARRLEERGFNRLMLDQIGAWRSRLDTADIEVDDPESQRWLNFACYHLVSAGNPHDERTSVSARALTGSIYKGHIFWDSEMFILPFFIFTHPPTARSLLMYRFHTLAAARENAIRKGYAGALFAWESTSTGADMTPAAVLDARGEIVPVLSGKLEHHISAAVAWGVWSYWNATGDDSFLVGAGAEILIETARFWASRVTEKNGRYHILGVEGPDEYHDEGVDDNFYTNAMARWNLRRAIEAVAKIRASFPQEWTLLSKKLGFDIGETARWQRVANNMYLGKSMAGGAGEADRVTPPAGAAATTSGALTDGAIGAGAPIEQFAGYFGLEDIDINLYEPRTAPLDVILGHRRTVSSQVVKQADMVMALYLLEDELSPAHVRTSFEYYDRRTSHGSSLSPAMHGLVAARLGLMDSAWHYFKKAARIDLGDGNAAGGIHVAAMGGLWQQVIMGFAGVRITSEGIYIFPRVPEQWGSVAFTLLWRNMQLKFYVGRASEVLVEVRGEGEAMVGIYGRELGALAAGGRYVSRWSDGDWGDFNAAGRVMATEPAEAVSDSGLSAPNTKRERDQHE